MSRPNTLGQLRDSGYRPRSVKDELRENLIDKLRKGQPLFEGIIGYDDTVITQLVNAILSKHDVLLLGLRGQAKSRLLRMLPNLLDEYTPTVAGFELYDDPLQPQFKQARQIVAEQGDNTEIRWVHRDERYHEKLATPDVTIADLIGEIDLVKHAEGRYLADESVMHFGLIPRTNRGIFAINELPDLPPRIQVGLFNVLEERDVQIRGFPIRLPLDVMLIFTANPEDYTSRGRIVTPLKDRIGAVICTHYPQTVEDAIKITEQNAWLDRDNGQYRIEIPSYMREIIEETVRLARSSPHINQSSGVSVRTSIACAETMVSNAERRGVLFDEPVVVPRISDLSNLAASCRGKIELMLADDPDTEDKLIASLLGEAVKNVFENYFDLDRLGGVVQAVSEGKAIEVGDDVPSADLVRSVSAVRGLKKAAAGLCKAAKLDPDQPSHLASAAEFILEALHVSNQLSKYAYRRRTFYKR
ncbi:MAG TPA: AAA family ATPase [Phycisphaerae bacterium]|nr:AAA family ATPase [Phycisphaerae bacterium]